jgi:Rho family protein
LNHPPQILICS